MKIIDPHVHLFDLKKGDYAWLKPENPPFWPDKARIHRDFSSASLALSKPAQLCGFVHIEAGFDNEHPWREIAWLEESVNSFTSTKNPLAFKSVASVHLTQSPKIFLSHLTRLKQCSSVVGVRHILDDAVFEMLKEDNVIFNFKQLESAGLLFEAQFDVNDSKSVQAFIHLASKVPHLPMVLNHAGFPLSEKSATWEAHIHALATLPSLWVKASGWEMTDRAFPHLAIEQHVRTLMAAFGEDRVMFASNFPLILFRSPYQALWDAYLAMEFPKETLHKLCYQNAKNCYQF